MSRTSRSPALRLTQEALRFQLARELLADIFRGNCKPGEPLRVMKLAARFGTSSTPVREALLELEELGAVDFYHNRGAVVAPFGVAELREMYDLRRILEEEATRRACGRLDREALIALRAETEVLASRGGERLPLADALSVDSRLHETVAQGCGNRRLGREIGRYSILMETLWEIVGNNDAVRHGALQAHLRIIDALLAEDCPAAVAAMGAHMAEACRAAEGSLFLGPRGDS